jgi:two-component system, chemotaxis family, protein-glutamate methylesterase/glutaminase
MTTKRAVHSQIRVLVVDDSAFMRTALARMIASDPAFEVVATAGSGSCALEKIASLNPDVVTLDVEMPGLDGLGTLRCIMNQFPRPVIMVSATTEKDAAVTFDALGAGAFDYVPKQLSPTSLDIVHIRSDLLAKIRAASLLRRPTPTCPSRKPTRSSESKARVASSTAPEIVALGTSTGGPKALEQILPRFPSDLSIPILIVQHMPPGFTASFAQRLDRLCSITVCEALHGQPIQAGTAYIAPAGQQMRIERHLSGLYPIICLDAGPDNAVHVPSVDILMQSVARIFKNRSMGVILTGMGSDGAEGMTAIYRQGGLTIGQDQASCAVYSMPRACAELGVLIRTVPLSDIPAEILQATRSRRRA